MDDNGVITVRDLRRRYGGTGGRGFDAVRGVTFSVRRGELFALLGTNGAGKTSVMEVLEGLALPARGAVRVLGCDPCRERAMVRRRMGIMRRGRAVDMRVDEHLVVSDVDRVVQHRPVKAELNALHRAQRPVQREGIADLGRHSVSDAFILPAISHDLAIRISEQDAHSDAGPALDLKIRCTRVSSDKNKPE